MADSLDVLEVKEPSGFVYFAANRYVPDVMKIGMTKRSPYVRMAELRSTGVIGSFDIVSAYFVVDCVLAERSLHDFHASLRLEQDREFFRVPTSEHHRFAVECGMLLARWKMIDPLVYFGIFARQGGNDEALRDSIISLEAQVAKLKKLLREKDEYIMQTLHNVR